MGPLPLCAARYHNSARRGVHSQGDTKLSTQIMASHLVVYLPTSILACPLSQTAIAINAPHLQFSMLSASMTTRIPMWSHGKRGNGASSLYHAHLRSISLSISIPKIPSARSPSLPKAQSMPQKGSCDALQTGSYHGAQVSRNAVG